MSHQTMLVTGANGYIGLHVIRECLSNDSKVIGIVRSEHAANRVRAIFPAATSTEQLKIIQVQGITQPEHFEPAFKDATITAVINTASPLINNPSDLRRDVLDPAIDSVVALLNAAASYGDESLHRLVHVSSCAAVLDPTLGEAPGKTYTSEDWNPLTYAQAVEGGQQLAYMASKALQERVLWQWKENHVRVAFDVTTIVPAAVFGPHYLGALEGKETIDLSHLNLSSQMLWALVKPESGLTPFNDYHLGCCTSVKDVATSLVAAVTAPTTGGQRVICAQRCHWQLVRDTVLSVLPELAGRIDPGTPGLTEEARGTTYDIDGSMVPKLLGIEYTPIGIALREAYLQMLEAEKVQIV